ncbi:MAG: ABC transporter ATP-binding protein [Terrisporobacter sp.]
MHIKIINYSKSIKEAEVLKNINVEFHGNKIYGIVGKNGSGKSVLLKSICGLANIDTGEILINNEVLGKDIEFPKDLGAVLDGAGFLPNLSGFKNLKLLASIKNKISDEKIKKCMEHLDLNPNDKKMYKSYSMGMKQKLLIAQAIMEDPKILILDEIFNGLDDDTVNIVRELLLKYKSEGRLIIITSHIKEDIDLLCDKIYKMNNGKMDIISDINI